MLRPLARAPVAARSSVQNMARLHVKAAARPTALTQATRPLAMSVFGQKTALIRSYADAAPGTTRSAAKEEKYAKEKLVVDAQHVNSSSTIGAPLSMSSEGHQEEDADMMAGIRHDVVCHEHLPMHYPVHG